MKTGRIEYRQITDDDSEDWELWSDKCFKDPVLEMVKISSGWDGYEFREEDDERD